MKEFVRRPEFICPKEMEPFASHDIDVQLFIPEPSVMLTCKKCHKSWIARVRMINDKTGAMFDTVPLADNLLHKCEDSYPKDEEKFHKPFDTLESAQRVVHLTVALVNAIGQMGGTLKFKINHEIFRMMSEGNVANRLLGSLKGPFVTQSRTTDELVAAWSLVLPGAHHSADESWIEWRVEGNDPEIKRITSIDRIETSQGISIEDAEVIDALLIEANTKEDECT